MNDSHAPIEPSFAPSSLIILQSVEKSISEAGPLIRLSSSPEDAQPDQTKDSGRTRLTLILLGLFLFYFLVTRSLTWRRLSVFPGPSSASISYWPMFLIRQSGQAHLKYASLSLRYGPLTRIGPNDLISSDPEHLRRMSAARSTYERSSWYQATRLDPYHDMMGSAMSKSAHMSLRTKLSGGYTGKDIHDLESHLDVPIQTLINLIQRKYLSQSPAQTIPLDFGRLADFYGHDAKSMLAFGKPLGMLEKDQDLHGLISTVKLALNWIQVFTDIPPLRRIFLSNTVLKLLGPKPTDSFGVGKLMGMARDFVAARFSPGAEDQQDLLGSFLRHNLDRRSAESEVMFPIIAGADTTATAIKMIVSHIASNATVAKELKEEIQEAISAGKLSSPATYAEAMELPYLQAVIWEGLRIHPPFGGLIMKQVGPDGDTFNGIFIPAGTRIGHSTWAVMRDAAVFGADVDTFRPERWLEADKEKKNAMQKQTELVFGSGRWGCPGRVVAFMEVNKVIIELHRKFDFQMSTGSRKLSRKEQRSFMEGSLPVVVTSSKGC